MDTCDLVCVVEASLRSNGSVLVVDRGLLLDLFGVSLVLVVFFAVAVTTTIQQPWTGKSSKVNMFGLVCVFEVSLLSNGIVHAVGCG